MASIAEGLGLRPDELAFYFASDRGVEVDALANFLKRVSTIAARKGGALRVVGLQQGSLIVKLRAIPKSAVAQNAWKEFSEKPLDGTIKVGKIAAGLAAAIAAAVVLAMSGHQGETPVAKAGAEIVDKHQVTEISVITVNNTTVVMNEQIARTIKAHRELAHDRDETVRHRHSEALTKSVMAMPRLTAGMAADFHHGRLTGEVGIFLEALHFKPDGFQFSVPVYSASGSQVILIPGTRYRVGGRIETRHGQPDRLVVETADAIPS